MNTKPVEVIPVKLDKPILPENYQQFSVAQLIKENISIEENDIIVITSKIVSILEGRCVKISDTIPTKKIRRLAKDYQADPAKLQLLFDEAKPFAVIPIQKIVKNPEIKKLFLDYSTKGLSQESKDDIIGQNKYVWMSSKYGHFLDGAGIDISNIPEGFAALLPKNPKISALNILKEINQLTGKNIGIIITDTVGGSPALQGHWDMPLAYSGIEPVEKNLGKEDLFGLVGSGGRANHIIPIAAMAGLVMGSCNECTPISVIRNLDCPIINAKLATAEDITSIGISKKHRLIFLSTTLIESFKYWLKLIFY